MRVLDGVKERKQTCLTNVGTSKSLSVISIDHVGFSNTVTYFKIGGLANKNSIPAFLSLGELFDGEHRCIRLELSGVRTAIYGNCYALDAD